MFVTLPRDLLIYYHDRSVWAVQNVTSGTAIRTERVPDSCVRAVKPHKTGTA